MSMIDEVKELQEIYKEKANGAVIEPLKSNWLAQAEECEELLTLFNEMKLSVLEWARLKELATIRREYRALGY